MYRAVFVYARSDSQRLPGKALMPLGSGRRPLLSIVLARARMVGAEACVLLTSDRGVDDGLAELGATQGVQVVRGNAFDLVQRTLQAIDITGATHFLRVNGDSPLFSPMLARQAIPHLDRAALISNLFDRRFPYGVAVEWVATPNYQDLVAAVEHAEREHVTAHLYRLHEIGTKISMTQCRNDSYLRLVVDTCADYNQVSALFGQTDPVHAEYWDLCKLTTPDPVFLPMSNNSAQF